MNGAISHLICAHKQNRRCYLAIDIYYYYYLYLAMEWNIKYSIENRNQGRSDDNHCPKKLLVLFLYANQLKIFRIILGNKIKLI